MRDDDYVPPFDALRLAAARLDGELQAQADHAAHVDQKAVAVLRASFAFSGVAAAAMYYVGRSRGPSAPGSIDNPFTYAALACGLASLVCAFATVTHTKIETELRPERIEERAALGRQELYSTMLETYVEYVRRNDRRIRTDLMLLKMALYTLQLAIGFTVLAMFASVGMSGISPAVPTDSVAFLLGGVAGAVAVIAARHVYGVAENRPTTSGPDSDS